MTPRDAGTTVRGWIERHTRAVLHTFACGDVPRDDRPDLAQEVFLTAYGILLRSLFTVEKPRAWLCAIAKRIACHYRREPGRRLQLAPVEDTASALANPEEGAEQRELVHRLLEQLGADARGVLLDVRAEGLTWEEVARARGLTVAKAKYLYRVAVQRMEAASREVAPASRRSFALALALQHTFTCLRAEADVSAGLPNRIWASIEEAMRGAVPMPTNDPADGSHARAISIEFRPPPAAISLGPILGLFGGGISAGLLLSCLLRAPAAPVRAPVVPWASSHTLALDELPPRRSGTELTEFAFTANGEADSPQEPRRRPDTQSPHRRSTVTPRRRPSGAFALLDQARAAVDAEDAGGALAALAQLARRFPQGPGGAERHHLLRLACAMPAARGAPDCAGAPPGLARE